MNNNESYQTVFFSTSFLLPNNCSIISIEQFVAFSREAFKQFLNKHSLSEEDCFGCRLVVKELCAERYLDILLENDIMDTQLLVECSLQKILKKEIYVKFIVREGVVMNNKVLAVVEKKFAFIDLHNETEVVPPENFLKRLRGN